MTTMEDVLLQEDQLNACWREWQADPKLILPQASLLETVIVPILTQLNDIAKEHNSNKKDNDNETVIDHTAATKALECLIIYLKACGTNRLRQKLVASSGALEEALQLFKHHYEESSAVVSRLTLELSTSLTMLSTSNALKHDYFLPAVPVVHRAMMFHTADERVQRWGCHLLKNLSNPLLQELAAAGSVDILQRALENHVDDAIVQEHGLAALYNLLPVTTTETLLHKPYSALLFDDNAIDNNDGIPAPPSDDVSSFAMLCPYTLRGMKAHADVGPVRQNGLLVLQRLCEKDEETFETILSIPDTDGLDVMRQLLEAACFDQTLAQLSCQFLRDMSKFYHTKCNGNIENSALSRLGNSLLESLLRVMALNVDCVNVQDPALCFLRNLCLDNENRQHVTDDDRKMILSVVDKLSDDAAIQAYGCDVLGRLTLNKRQQKSNDNNNNDSSTTSSSSTQSTNCPTKEDEDNNNNKNEKSNNEGSSVSTTANSILNEDEADDAEEIAIVEDLDLAYRAMKTHSSHAGVQDRAVFWILVVVASSSNSFRTVKLLNERHSDWMHMLKTTTVPTHGKSRLDKVIRFFQDNADTEKENNTNLRASWMFATRLSSWSSSLAVARDT